MLEGNAVDKDDRDLCRKDALDIDVVDAIAIARVEPRVIVIVEDEQGDVGAQFGFCVFKFGAKGGRVASAPFEPTGDPSGGASD